MRLRSAIFVFLAAIFLLTGCFHKAANPTEPTITDMPDEMLSRQFVVRGMEIFEVSAAVEPGNAPIEKKLFVNVKNVAEARLGPDKKTIHFKLAGPQNPADMAEFGPQALCANLESKVTPAEPDYENPPPSQPPWDYRRIAHYATIEGCGHYGGAGGYLKNSPYFAFIRNRGSSWKDFVLENIEDGTRIEKRIEIGELPAADPAGNSPVSAPILDNRGIAYYYPHQDAVIAGTNSGRRDEGDRIVLAFGTTIVVADPTRNMVSWTSPSQPVGDGSRTIIAESFQLHTRKNLPFVVMESGWEGSRIFELLIDASGDNLVEYQLNNYPQPFLAGYKTPLLEWDEKGLTFNLYRTVDVMDQISADDLAIFSTVGKTQEEWDELTEKMEKKNLEIQKKLQASGKYVEVFCYLPPGLSSGCTALVPGEKYRIEPGGKLEKI